MKMSGRGFGAFLLLLSSLLLTSCVTEQLEPEDRPKLGVAKSGDNMVFFALQTKVGYKYSILYQSTKDKSWNPIAGCESIIGTGETIEIEKKFNSNGPLPPFTVNYSKL
ncbi:MAG: hypothetical protein V5783_10185 [Pontiella sp.]